MKKHFIILSLVSLALTVVSAKATSTQNDSEITQLPAYHVSADRYTPAERAVEASLAEMRATANVRATRVLLPDVSTKVAAEKASIAAEIARKPLPATRVAKS